MDNKILIDTSYVIYYKFYATIKWYSTIYSEEYSYIEDVNNHDWTVNSLFMSLLEKTINNFLLKLFNNEYLEKSDIIFALDSNRLNNWKYKLYPEYKKNRVHKKYFDKIFAYVIENILSKFLTKYKSCKIIKIEELEADDIIAIIAKHYTANNICIVSADSDFLQLGADNIFFINLKSCIQKQISKEEANELLKTKILYGDKSDNIPSIFKRGYKIKKAELLNDDILEEYFKRNDTAKDQYLLNKSIIDFNEIPNKYIEIVLNHFI